MRHSPVKIEAVAGRLSKSPAKTPQMPVFALIIVDPQTDFGSSSGSLYVPQGEQIVAATNELRAALAEKMGENVFITLDWHPADHISFYTNHEGAAPYTQLTLPNGEIQDMWPPHCVQGSDGAGILPGLVQQPTDTLVHKGCLQSVDSYSGFGSADGKSEITPLHAELQRRGVTHVFVCGLAFEFCVSATAKDAARLGYKTCVVSSATRGIKTEVTEVFKAVSELVSAGVHVASSGPQALELMTS